MENLLVKWGFGEFIPAFQENGIDVDMLKEVTEDSYLKCLIPQIGQRIRFKKNVDQYLLEKHDTQSISSLSSLNSLAQSESLLNSENSTMVTMFNSTLNDDMALEQNSAIDATNAPLIYTVVASNPSTSIAMTDSVLTNKPKLAQNTLENFNLEELLNKTCVGRAIISIYESQRTLDTKCQSYLVDLIASHFLNDYDKRLVNEDFDILAQRIVSLFPNETKDLYYTPPIRKRQSRENKSGVAKGKLIDKYRNKLTFLRRAETRQNLRFRDAHLDDENTEINNITEIENDDHVIWLKHNVEPWSDVLCHWENCLQFRTAYLKKDLSLEEVFEHWPILKNTLGHTLITFDFKNLYPSEINAIYTRWENTFQKLLNIRKKTLNQTDDLLLDILKSSNTNEEYRHYLMLTLLPSLIACKARFTGRGKNQWKPSLAESREGIVVKVDLASEVQAVVETKKKKLQKIGLVTQPFIIVQTETTTVQAVYVSVHDTLYKINSILKAIDVCFQIFHVLSLKYPIESEHIWLYIQLGVYEIQTKFDNKIPFIMDIIQKLKITQ